MPIFNSKEDQRQHRKAEKTWESFKDFILLLFLLDLLIASWDGGGSKFRTEVSTDQVVKAEEQSEAPEGDSPILVAIRLGEFSAYTADENQTDSRPREMANGQEVFIGAVANNCLPFGTKIDIGGEVYIVSDRMNSRYGCDHFDLYFEDRDEAIRFGRKQLGYTL